MRTLAQSAYIESSFHVDSELPHAGSALENPFVYDDAARELKAMAAQGLVKIVAERCDDGDAAGTLIRHLRFRRLR